MRRKLLRIFSAAASCATCMLPAAAHEPLLQKMVLIKGAGTTARAFRDFLEAPAVRALFARYGFQASP